MKSKASNRAARQLYATALSEVRGIITAWDPYELIAGGAPTDEFDGEISALLPLLRNAHSSDDASLAVSKVFSKAFHPHDFVPEKCAMVGEQLYRALVKSGFARTKSRDFES